jgi:Fe-S-cluster containining protein
MAVLKEGFPGQFDTGRLTDDEQALDRFIVRHATMRCPALDPISGFCDLYEARPVACRTYGPPISFGGADARSHRTPRVWSRRSSRAWVLRRAKSGKR